ncbi:MAG: 23S rRNA (uracil(1939)-C(5))-methyltransferase RlmD [Candidatus Acidiferrales bacterium]
MRAKIEKLVYGGEGLAHEGAETLFVPFVLPGEEVEIEIAERKKKLLRGRATQLLKTSPQRVEPRCPHFGVCGGCDYQHISYDAQLEIKEEILRETLRRIGRIDWKEPITVHRSPPWEYRNRAQWKIRPFASPQPAQPPAETSSIGYFQARSSVLCPVETCSIISPKLLATFQTLRGALANGKLPSTLREIEAFADAGDNELLLTVTCSSVPRSPEPLLQTLSQILPSAKSILLQDTRGVHMSLFGSGFLQYEVLQKRFRVGHLSFFQVNRFLVEEMAGVVCELAGSGELAFDLYAGVGLFAALLAERFSQVAAIEADPASARDLESVARSSRTAIAVHNQPAGLFLREWKNKRGSHTPDVIVVDPPRAGVEDGVAGQLMALAPRKIVYVSCDPSTLARDLAKLSTQAYTLRELHLLDIFPQTYHIESVVLLERGP